MVNSMVKLFLLFEREISVVFLLAALSSQAFV